MCATSQALQSHSECSLLMKLSLLDFLPNLLTIPLQTAEQIAGDYKIELKCIESRSLQVMIVFDCKSELHASYQFTALLGDMCSPLSL